VAAPKRFRGLRFVARAVLALLLFGVAVLALTPTGRYLLRGAWEESKILWHRRPIRDMIADSTSTPALRDKLTQALIGLTQTPDGQRALSDFAGIDGLHPTTDATYESVRKAVEALNIDLEKAVGKG